jgi:hypothetical protein
MYLEKEMQRKQRSTESSYIVWPTVGTSKAKDKTKNEQLAWVASLIEVLGRHVGGEGKIFNSPMKL